MDSSVPSTSSSPSHRLRVLKPTQPIADRIHRALRHRLLLLHRPDPSTFFVLGATGNVYTVSLSATPSCSCPDRTSPCKHILFVLLRVLSLSPDDLCLRRRTLRPCQLTQLFATPASPDSLAGARLRQVFHRLFFLGKQPQAPATAYRPRVEVEEGSACPICLDEMTNTDKLAACRACRNAIHEECFLRWKKSKGRRSASCVICRARWRDIRSGADQEKYLNLTAYVKDDVDQTANDGGGHCGG